MLLLTGASGFIGGEVLRSGLRRGLSVRPVFRKPSACAAAAGDAILVPTLAGDTDWTAALNDVDVVIHCAARVHVMKDSAADPLEAFREINVRATLNLARQAAQVGVRRFVFVSSIKVNGERTSVDGAYSAKDEPEPEDAYGRSKAEAEAALKALANETGLEVVIIRPPLVYGPGAKGNFLKMVQWVSRGVPLPLGGVTDNRRSFVALDNLVDLILTCASHPHAANQTFLVSDGEDLSTAELLSRVALALNRHPWLIRVPPTGLRLCLGLLGKQSVADRLLGSLRVDMTSTRELLDWTPPVSVDEELRKVALSRL